MYRIGEFSILSKTTIKTLRYYEKEELLIPSYVDKMTGYRFYESKNLLDLAKIISLRQLGFSINDIKSILHGKDLKILLNNRKEEIENLLSIYNNQLSKINYLMEGKEMKYEVITKELPEYVVYYKEGILKSFNELPSFIIGSGQECLELNPNIKCMNPDYCYVEYLDGEYKDKEIKIRYSQAVEKEGVSNENIKFKKLEPTVALCIYHKGSYETIREAYGFIMEYIEKNGYEISGFIRERYIDGMWNKENSEDWLTEIQVPIKNKK